MAVEYQRETAALDTVVPLSPTAGALTDILSKAAGARTFDKATDSLEMLSDKAGAYTGDGGAAADDSVKAELDLIKAKTDTITGAAVSSASATTTGIIAEDSAMGTGTPNVVTVASTTTANNFGSWVEVDASVSADSWLCSIIVTPTDHVGLDINTVIEIGTGAAGSEVSKIRFSFLIEVITAAGVHIPFQFSLPIPIKVASGTRIAARVSDSEAAINNYGLSVQYYQTIET